jgi:hypothetical protein
VSVCVRLCRLIQSVSARYGLAKATVKNDTNGHRRTPTEKAKRSAALHSPVEITDESNRCSAMGLRAEAAVISLIGN